MKKRKKTRLFNNELCNKILFTILLLSIIQIVSNIPIYGINREFLSEWLNSETGSAFGLFNMFSGNALSNMSIFVIGISPYITASIVMQLLKAVIPSLDEMAKDGKIGQDKFKRMMYILAGILAVLQAIPVAYGFASYGLLVEKSTFYISLVSVTLIIGSILLIYLGSLIDKKGIGNGISLILLFNILSKFPNDFTTIYSTFCAGKGMKMTLLVIGVVALVVTIALVGIIYLQDGEKRIPIQYSSQVKGLRNLSNESTNFIPIKVNIAGVMPIIFATSLFQLYSMVITLMKVDSSSIFYKVSQLFNQANWFQWETLWYNLGFIVYCLLIFMFAYFYTTLVFDPEEVADNLRKANGVVVGVRPGAETEEFLDKKLSALRKVGCVCLIAVTVFPMIISSIFGISNLAFGGTSIIIVVGVIIETYKTIEAERLETATSSFLF